MTEEISYNLDEIAKQALVDHGLRPDFSPASLEQLSAIDKPHIPLHVKDLTNFIWCSIDNNDSRDLDQLTFATNDSQSGICIYIAIADVDSLVLKQSPLDQQAQFNTTSIYTPSKIFPMLPEKLSTNLTSLNENEIRAAIVIKIEVGADGRAGKSSFLQAIVKNYAKLAYPSLGAWLEGRGPMPEKIIGIHGLEQNLRLQSQAAQLLKKNRSSLGALSLQTVETKAKIKEKAVVEINEVVPNLATELIENFMIAANEAIAKALTQSGLPSLRRVVRVPKRWDRIVELSEKYGEPLPEKPDSIALDNFLSKMKNKDPVSFPDISLSVIKLLGNGEYVVQENGELPLGHFGLALREYTHSTAPNRRYPDLITQRQLKALLMSKDPIYNLRELNFLADHCTRQEDSAAKVERQLSKSAAALFLSHRIGEKFKGIVTGASEKGTWVRIFNPPVEGKVVKGYKNLDVGDRVEVELVQVDVLKGYIDFQV